MLDDANIVDAVDAVKEWLKTGDTGASSKAIAAYILSVGEPTGCYPSDGDDFGRCERLLEAAPYLRKRLGDMAMVNAYWEALVSRWEEIRAANDQTALIREIVRPIEDADPAHSRMSSSVSMRMGGPITFKGEGGPKMKETPEDREVADKAYRVASSELRQFIERFERLEAEKKDIADQQKEVMSEAKMRGYDTKVMRMVIALRKRAAEDIAEEEAVLEMYKEALGMR